jgi:hypothetical protein
LVFKLTSGAAISGKVFVDGSYRGSKSEFPSESSTRSGMRDSPLMSFSRAKTFALHLCLRAGEEVTGVRVPLSKITYSSSLILGLGGITTLGDVLLWGVALFRGVAFSREVIFVLADLKDGLSSSSEDLSSSKSCEMVETSLVEGVLISSLILDPLPSTACINVARRERGGIALGDLLNEACKVGSGVTPGSPLSI